MCNAYTDTYVHIHEHSYQFLNTDFIGVDGIVRLGKHFNIYIYMCFYTKHVHVSILIHLHHTCIYMNTYMHIYVCMYIHRLLNVYVIYA